MILLKQRKYRTSLKRLVSTSLFLFLLIPTLFSSVSAATPDGSEEYTNYLRSSYNAENYLEFSVSDNTLTVGGILQLDGLSGVMVQCGEEKAWLQNISSNTYFSASFHLPSLIPRSGDPVPVSVYTKRDSEEYYWSLSWDRVYVTKAGNEYQILSSCVENNNLAFANTWLYPKTICPMTYPSLSLPCLTQL